MDLLWKMMHTIEITPDNNVPIARLRRLRVAVKPWQLRPVTRENFQDPFWQAELELHWRLVEIYHVIQLIH